MKIKPITKESIKNLNREASRLLHSYVIGPMEKGFETAKLQAPSAHVVDGVDLRVLPKFISYIPGIRSGSRRSSRDAVAANSKR